MLMFLGSKLPNRTEYSRPCSYLTDDYHDFLQGWGIYGQTGDILILSNQALLKFPFPRGSNDHFSHTTMTTKSEFIINFIWTNDIYDYG